MILRHRMQLVWLCATHRGYRVTQKLFHFGRKLAILSGELPALPRIHVWEELYRVAESKAGGGATVLTGDGLIRLKSVQFEGEPVVNAGEILKSPSQTLGEQER